MTDLDLSKLKLLMCKKWFVVRLNNHRIMTLISNIYGKLSYNQHLSIKNQCENIYSCELYEYLSI